MEERENSERKTGGLNKRLQELFASLSVTLGEDYGQPNTSSFDKVLTRVKEKMIFLIIQLILFI